MDAKGWKALIFCAALVAIGCCNRKPSVSPLQGMALPEQPINRMEDLPDDAPLDVVAQAAMLDREDRGNYAKALEDILVKIGAVKTPAKK